MEKLLCLLDELNKIWTNQPKSLIWVNWSFKYSLCLQGQMDEDVQKALKQILMMCKMPGQAKDACWDAPGPIFP